MNIIYLNKNVNVRLFTIKYLEKFITECFEILTELCACFYVPFSGEGGEKGEINNNLINFLCVLYITERGKSALESMAETYFFCNTLGKCCFPPCSGVATIMAARG